MRSLLRWLRRIALSAVALTLLVLAAALSTAHTDWGRERLRLRVEAALHGAFPAGARVGSLDGSVLGTLTLRSVELDVGPVSAAFAHEVGVRRGRRVQVNAGTAHVAVALWPLLFQTARLDRLVAEDVRVSVRDLAVSPPEPARAAASPWRVEMPDVAVRRATVEIERARLTLDDLDAAVALTFADGRLAIAGAAHGRWVRADGPSAELTVNATATIDGGVHVPAALVVLDGAAIGATGVELDVDHPRGSITVVAPATAVARLVPELGCAAPAALGDVVAAIELAEDGADATRLAVAASSGEARLWVAAGGELARRAARALVSATAVDLELVTCGRIHGHGNLIAAFGADRDGARGALIAYGDVDAAGLPVRRAGIAIAGSLDRATAWVLGGGDEGLQIAARANLSGTLVPRPDLRIDGVASGTQLVVESGRVDAAATGPIRIAALRSPFRACV